MGFRAKDEVIYSRVHSGTRREFSFKKKKFLSWVLLSENGGKYII